MSYIGENVAVADFTKQSFTPNGSNVTFTLSSAVTSASCLMVSVGGVVQEPDEAYTASGTTLAFSVAPTVGSIIYVVYIGKSLPYPTHSADSITEAMIPDGIITDSKIHSLSASQLTGALPAIDGSTLTGIAVDTSGIEDNIALLGFKLAANNSLAKFNLVDRTIDEYQDATGIDVSSSTYETAGGTGTGKYYSSTSSAPLEYNYVTPSISTKVSTSPNLQQHGDSSGNIGSHVHNNNWGFSVDTQDAQTWVGGWCYDDLGAGNEKSFAQSAVRLDGTNPPHTATTGKYDVYASNDASTWVLIHTGTTGTWNTAATGTGTEKIGGIVYQFTAPETAYRYWKISFIEHTGSTSNNDWSEVRFYEGTGGAVYNATMSLQSTSTTASTAPTKGDITLLIEDVSGTATLNTDIKAYVSRDGGSGWDQGTLVHEGTWGTNKKVLSFHDQTFSNSASGTDMRYKITTHNQSVSKETRIHATSLAWA